MPPPGPTALEKDEKERETKLVVEIKEGVEIYPMDPRPVTVDVKLTKLRSNESLIEETSNRWELKLTARAVPATSSVAPGLAV